MRRLFSTSETLGVLSSLLPSSWLRRGLLVSLRSIALNDRSRNPKRSRASRNSGEFVCKKTMTSSTFTLVDNMLRFIAAYDAENGPRAHGHALVDRQRLYRGVLGNVAVIDATRTRDRGIGTSASKPRSDFDRRPALRAKPRSKTTTAHHRPFRWLDASTNTSRSRSRAASTTIGGKLHRCDHGRGRCRAALPTATMPGRFRTRTVVVVDRLARARSDAWCARAISVRPLSEVLSDGQSHARRRRSGRHLKTSPTAVRVRSASAHSMESGAFSPITQTRPAIRSSSSRVWPIADLSSRKRPASGA